MKVYVWDKVDWVDPSDQFYEIQCWAQDNCKSFVYMNVIDVSDVSSSDYVGEFEFTDERDATMFTLRWAN